MSTTAPIERPTREGGSGTPTLAVRNLWKVFGPAEHKTIGTPDADLPRAELKAKTGCVAGVKDVSFEVAPGEIVAPVFTSSKISVIPRTAVRSRTRSR